MLVALPQLHASCSCLLLRIFMPNFTNMRLIYTILCLSLSLQLCAQTNPKVTVKQAAINMGTALLTKDYDAFLETTYPKALEATPGGAAKIISDLKKQVKTMEESGNSITGMWPGEPSDMIDTAGELQCTMPQYMKITMPNGLLTVQTTLICISPDKGRRWYFIDTVDRSLNDIRSLFTTISSKLVIPPATEPVYESGSSSK